MSAIENKFCSIAAPVSAADDTGKKGVHRIAITASSGSLTVPAEMKGRFVRVKAVSTDVQVAFKESAQTLVWNQAAALGTGHLAAGETVFAGTQEGWLLTTKDAYLNWVANGSGYLEVICAEVPQIGSSL